MSVDVGLLVLRIAIGFILFAHATQKVFGWFNGPGLDKAAGIFEGLGQHPGRKMAVLASVCESTASVLLVLGVATPAGAAIGAGTMLVAGVALNFKAPSRWNTGGGGEFPLLLAVVVTAIGFAGPGRFSLDAVLGWMSVSADIRVGMGAVVLALAAATVPIVRTARAARLRRQLATESRD